MSPQRLRNSQLDDAMPTVHWLEGAQHGRGRDAGPSLQRGMKGGLKAGGDSRLPRLHEEGRK